MEKWKKFATTKNKRSCTHMQCSLAAENDGRDFGNQQHESRQQQSVRGREQRDDACTASGLEVPALAFCERLLHAADVVDAAAAGPLHSLLQKRLVSCPAVAFNLCSFSLSPPAPV